MSVLFYTHKTVSVTGTHRLPVTSKGWSALSRVNHCQGQLQTPQSLSVVTVVSKEFVASVCCIDFGG